MTRGLFSVSESYFDDREACYQRELLIHVQLTRKKKKQGGPPWFRLRRRIRTVPSSTALRQRRRACFLLINLTGCLEGKTEQVSGGKKRGVMPEKLASFHETVIGRESEFLIEGKHFLHLGMFDCVLLARPPCWSVNVTANKLLPN